MPNSAGAVLRKIGKPAPEELLQAARAHGVRFGGNPDFEVGLRRICVVLSLWMRRLHAIFEGADPRRLPPKENILLVGPTGSGKTFLAERLCGKALGLPFVQEDISQFTSAGYVGRDVPSLLARLIDAAGGDADLARIGVLCIDEIDKIARPGRRSRDVKADVAGELLRVVDGGESIACFRSGYYGPSGDMRTQVTLPTENILIIACGAFDGIDRIVERRVGPSTPFGFGPTRAGEEPGSRKLTAQDLIDYGMLAELTGRFAHLIELPSPPRGFLRRLAQDEIERRMHLWQISGAAMSEEFRTDAFLDRVVDAALQRPAGARAIPAVIAELTSQAAFEQLSAVPVAPATIAVHESEPAGTAPGAHVPASVGLKFETHSHKYYGSTFELHVSEVADGGPPRRRIVAVSIHLANAPYFRIAAIGRDRLKAAFDNEVCEFVALDRAQRLLKLRIKPGCHLLPSELVRYLHTRLVRPPYS